MGADGRGWALMGAEQRGWARKSAGGQEGQGRGVPVQHTMDQVCGRPDGQKCRERVAGRARAAGRRCSTPQTRCAAGMVARSAKGGWPSGPGRGTGQTMFFVFCLCCVCVQ